MKKLICKIIGHKWTNYIEDPCGEYYVKTCKRCNKRRYKMPTIENGIEWDE